MHGACQLEIGFVCQLRKVAAGKLAGNLRRQLA
jgi:hypothetical protein